MSYFRVALFTVISLGPIQGASSGDSWPQWGGPTRDFQRPDVHLNPNWPQPGLRAVWKRKLGDGYSSVAVVGRHAYSMAREEGDELIVCLAKESGDEVWTARYAAPFRDGTDLEFGPGPHGTPLVVGNRVITSGVTGMLQCRDARDGTLRWKHALLEKFQGTNLFRGYSISPIAFEQTVIVTVGGQNRGVMSFDLDDGRVVWQSQDLAGSHVSPLLIRTERGRQLVVFADQEIVGLDPSTGRRLWSHKHGLIGGHIASTPVWGNDSRLVFSGAYGAGTFCLDLLHSEEQGTWEARQSWHNAKVRVHHSNLLRLGDTIYAASGDFGPKVFAAVDVPSGKVLWRTRDIGRASCLRAGRHVIILQEDGHCSLASLTRDGMTEHAKCRLFEGQAWTPPSLVGNRLFVRNRDSIMAFELPVTEAED